MNGERREDPRVARGFTLIELLVVMAILATLLLLAVPRYYQSLERARVATLQQDLAVMRGSLDDYFGDHGRYPDRLEELVEQRYLRAIPPDPITRSAETWQLVRATDPGVEGIQDVRSGATGVARDGRVFGEL